MKRYITVVMLFLLCLQAQAKTIIVGSHGGKEVALENFTLGEYYDPRVEHENDRPFRPCGDEYDIEDGCQKKADKVSPLSSVVGSIWNADRNDPTPAHGIDAAIVYFDEKSNETINAFVAHEAANFFTGYYLIKDRYNPGDKIVLLGYSGGARYVTRLAYLLSITGYPVHLLGMIDPVGIPQDMLVPWNVRDVALYYQDTKVYFGPFPGLVTTSLRFSSGQTAYFGGHPKHVDITINTPNNADGSRDHYVIPYEPSVWKDLGQKMVAMAPGSASDDKTNDLPQRTDEELVEELLQNPDVVAIVDIEGDDNEDTGTTPTDPDPWSGYNHKVGLDYVKAKWKEQSNWHSSLDTTKNYEYDEVELIAKLERNGEHWIDGNTCVKWYLTEESYKRSFSTDSDDHLDEDCDVLTEGKSAEQDYYKFYGKAKIASHMKSKDERHIFVRVFNDKHGKVNKSTETEGEEHVKIVYDTSNMRFPDLITTGLSLAHGKRELFTNDLFGLQVWGKNIGTVASGKKTRLSYEIFRDGKWHGFSSDDVKDLNPGQADHEHISTKSLKRAPMHPGTYRYRSCIDYYQSIRESNERNNCSEITLEVKAKHNGSVPWFAFSPAGPRVGMYCVSVNEPSDPHTWADNYFCSRWNYQMKWSYAGPIPNMRCTQIHEGADGPYWRDNYLCVPHSSNIYMWWSSAGVSGRGYCPRWHEGADPNTWHDNYLCIASGEKPRSDGSQRITRYYNPYHDSHYFNIHNHTKASLENYRPWQWDNHGFSFRGWSYQAPGTIPIWHCWSSPRGTHRLHPSKGYVERYCGSRATVAFYNYPGPGPSRYPVRELTNRRGHYIYSNGEGDANNLVKRWGFRKHGILWYAPY